MNILSSYWGICASASLYQNGKILAAAHEERFTRRKNEDAFPSQAIAYCLKAGNSNASDLSGVAIASLVAPCNDTLLRKFSTWSIDDYIKEQHEQWKPYLVDKTDTTLKSLIDVFPERINTNAFPSQAYWESMLKLDNEPRQKKFEVDRETMFADHLGIEPSRVRRIEHHRCHSYYAYYSAPFRDEPVLVFTLDGWGDGVNATIGIMNEKGDYERLYGTDQCQIGRIYRYVTLLLGMKPNEHEYKVMGLAPYGKEKHAKKAIDLFKSTLYVDGLEFKWKTKPEDSYFWFRDRLEGVRFDNIAYALQLWTEDLICDWIGNAINEFGIGKIVVSGGVAMNIKAMGKVAELPQVESMFVGGSGSDESMAISAGICLAQDLAKEQNETWHPSDVKPFNLYLGPAPTKTEEKALVAGLAGSNLRILNSPTTDQVAHFLRDGKVIARCVGRMEFGQRSLGNRSILADPQNVTVKEKINAMIKNRDFWMPFAPIVLDTYVDKYLSNPKQLQSPFMTIGFNTTNEGYESMRAACHPADKSARPQILDRPTNPDLYALIESFERLTGRGAILNTSFNLHGYPIVNTPNEAYDVFNRSGLDGLLLSEHLILKP